MTVSNTPTIQLLNIDCMEYMATLPDKAFELAIVDPPYGIGDKISIGGAERTKSKVKFHQLYNKSAGWDIAVNEEYFNELIRVSKNQIIWGANYYVMPPCRGFVIWDKNRVVPNFSNLEFAWTSFDVHPKMFKYCNNAGFILKPSDARIHPTQKPIALYRWLLHNYAKPGDRILDTHLGSASSAIAAHQMGFDFVGCELDKDYYDASIKRFKEQTKQLSLL